MIKRFVAVILLLLSLSVVQAQDSWTSWVYNNGQIYLVNPFGETNATIHIELNPAYNSISQQIAVSASGRYIAYIASDTMLETPNRQLFIYDVAIRSDVAGYPLPASVQATQLDVFPVAAMFDEAHNRAAFGYVLDERATGGEFGWEVVILDYQIDTVIEKLSYQNTPAQIIDWDLIIPVIFDFDGEQVSFAAINYDEEILPQYPAYIWDSGTDRVSLSAQPFSLVRDHFAVTGENAYALNAPQFAALPQETGEASNVILVDNTVVYHTPDGHISGVYFIQNGERLLIRERDEANTVHWRILDRDGTLTDVLQSAFINPQIHGTKDGFVALDGNTLFFVDTRNGDVSPRSVWASTDMGIPQLVLVQNNALPAESYPAWTALGE
ncbi:MAG: hypothetical protein CUN56_06165 [Phototrophicales bacterium]|nr:MAG: hypothetical protein CUN56_06165 [Phototrophicales bacterium]RMG74135.1 MAG: hypothetical protein D6711_09725 [Chloroflexota bacterium]